MFSAYSGLDAYLHRMTATGDPLWSYRVPFTYGTLDVATLSDGSVVAVSKTCGWVAGLDADGTVLWQKVITFPNNNLYGGACTAIPWIRQSDGVEGVVVAGTVDGGTPYPLWGFVAADGTVGAFSQLDSPGRIHGGRALPSGGIALVGRHQAGQARGESG